jgi:hypothetical protein
MEHPPPSSRDIQPGTPRHDARARPGKRHNTRHDTLHGAIPATSPRHKPTPQPRDTTSQISPHHHSRATPPPPNPSIASASGRQKPTTRKSTPTRTRHFYAHFPNVHASRVRAVRRRRRSPHFTDIIATNAWRTRRGATATSHGPRRFAHLPPLAASGARSSCRRDQFRHFITRVGSTAPSTDRRW